MFQKIAEWIEAFNLKFSITTRIVIIGGLLLVVVTSIFGSIFGTQIAQEKAPPEDMNVYLNEEVCFAKDIYIKVVGLSVDENESEQDTEDADGDTLSAFTLNLTIKIEQRTENKGSNTMIKSQMFTLKSSNIKSKSNMGMFFSALAKTTAMALVSGVVSGSVNIIEETINLAGEYVTEISENVSTKKSKFKPIKATKKQFEEFKPKEKEGVTTVELSFPIKQEYLESENTIVLTIDAWNHWERRIFLILRPE